MKTLIIISFTFLLNTLSIVKETKVSWYGPGFHGKTTANGEKYNQNDLTCASPILPFNTKIKVTNISNGKFVIVRVNDRGPYKMNKTGKALMPLTPHPTRSLDLSKASFEKISDIDVGVLKVRLEILK